MLPTQHSQLVRKLGLVGALLAAPFGRSPAPIANRASLRRDRPRSGPPAPISVTIASTFLALHSAPWESLRKCGRAKLRTTLRIVAVFCILSAAPLTFFSFLWLPAELKEFVQLQRAPAGYAMSDFYRYREARLHEMRYEFLLYAVGAAAVGGLWFIAVGVLDWRGELAIWSVTAIAGGSTAQFMHAWLLPGKESTAPYIFAVDVPAGIAAIAAIGAVATLASHFLRKPAAQ